MEIEDARLKLVALYDKLGGHQETWRLLHQPGQDNFYEACRYVQALRMTFSNVMRHRAIVLQPRLYEEADTVMRELDDFQKLMDETHIAGNVPDKEIEDVA